MIRECDDSSTNIVNDAKFDRIVDGMYQALELEKRIASITQERQQLTSELQKDYNIRYYTQVNDLVVQAFREKVAHHMMIETQTSDILSKIKARREHN